MGDFFLGVDGGQSSTVALIGDEAGRVLGRGKGGPCNHVKSGGGREKFLGAVRDSIGAACGQAGLKLAAVRFRSACLGFSGGPADKEALIGEVIASEQTLVTHDGLIALSGATAGEPGVICVAGTGSLAFGRNREGGTARAGGWGYVFGDEGGGFDITRQALRAALRQEEGWGIPTKLHGALLDATGASDANDLMHRFYTVEFPRPRIAQFSRVVDAAAQDGDAVAREILHEAARQLALFVAAVRQQLFDDQETVAVRHIGGVFRSAFVLERFRTLLELAGPNEPGAPLYGPAAGALIEAYRNAGLQPTLTNLPEDEK